MLPDKIIKLLRPDHSIALKDNLVDLIEDGETFTILPVHSRIEQTKNFSNHAETPFKVNKILYRSSEHYLMWRKALLFNDDETADKILKAPSAVKAMMLGRAIKPYDETLWKNHRWAVAVDTQVNKFKSYKVLIDREAPDTVFAEVTLNPLWGCGCQLKTPQWQDPTQWTGVNLHGFAILEARYRLSEGI